MFVDRRGIRRVRFVHWVGVLTRLQRILKRIALRSAVLGVSIALATHLLTGAPVVAQEVESPTPVPIYDTISSRLGGWSPQFEFGFGVLTQSQDGEATIPTNGGSSVLRDSGDSIISGFTGFGLNALSPVVVESSWKPRVVIRSSVQIPLSDGLISNRADVSFDRGTDAEPPPGFTQNCPDPVIGSSVPTSTCSIELRNRTTVNVLWTAGLGLDLLLPIEEKIFHIQPAVEYIGMKAQPEGSFSRTTSGSIATPLPGQSARYVEFIKQVGASEIFHGVATSLTASADAYRDGPWIWSIFVNGRAAWFLTDREIATRRTDTAGNFVFVTEPAVNDAKEVQWQAMAGFTVRFDPLSEGLSK